ncbi:MAG: methyltransferase domain-containing protein, partial [Paucibacter sp.]|nr:methyltransferase domain-containing protein [Roseateles sp.]
TTARVLQSELSVIAPEHQAEARPYFMTRARALRRAFAQSGAPLDRRFVDVGSGKGKVVITAALFGFKRIIGIEFAPELVKLAQQNLAKIQSQIPAGTEVEVVCADATNFSYGPDDCVFFLYNPFGAEVMRGFCQQLAKSLADHPRRLWIIYTDPAFIDVMLGYLPVREHSRMTYGGFEIAFLMHEPS